MLYQPVCKRLLTILMLIFSSLMLTAQVNVGHFNDIGVNRGSDGVFVTSSFIVGYRINNNSFSTIVSTRPIGNNSSFITDYNIAYTRHMTIRDHPVDGSLFFLRNNNSRITFESNLGGIFDITTRYTVHKLGVGWRSYSYTRSAADEYSIDDNDVSLNDLRLYALLGAFIKPVGNRWNVGLILTNIDKVRVNNTILPSIVIRGEYEILPNLELYVEPCYNVAGLTTLCLANYGFFFRTGISWSI